MSDKPKIKPKAAALDVNGTFVAVVKDSHLLYSAVEVRIEHGSVVAIRRISRAPDMLKSAIGAAEFKIRETGSSQQTAEVWPDEGK